MNEEMKDTVAALDTKNVTIEDAEEGKGGVRRRGLTSMLSVVSRRYDVDGDGMLDEAEQTMRDMDTDDKGYLTNDKVYKIMVEQMKLQQEVFSLKRLSLVFLVIMVFLSLATLGSSFAAATLAKDTDVKNGSLVEKNGGGTVATSNAAKTFIVLEGATLSNGRRTQASGVLTIPRVDADDAFKFCDTTYVRLERSCTADDVSTIVEIPICPGSTQSISTDSSTKNVLYTFDRGSDGTVKFDCPSNNAPCTVNFPDTTQGCSNDAFTKLVPPTPVVSLGSASYYTILAKTGISTVPQSIITGDIAVSPSAATFITGFNLELAQDGQSSTDLSSQFTGKAFGASYGGDTASDLTVAVDDMGTAFTDAYSRPNSNAKRINIGGGNLGGEGLPGGPDAPLTSGIYTFGTGVILKGNLHFKGAVDDVFIIQIANTLSMDANFNVILDANEDNEKPSAKNIFWAVSEKVEVGAGAHMKGIILGKTAVAFITDSSLEGRVLAQTACTLQSTTITPPTKGDGF